MFYLRAQLKPFLLFMAAMGPIIASAELRYRSVEFVVPGHRIAWPVAMNNVGQVVGAYSENEYTRDYPGLFLYDRGTTTDLGRFGANSAFPIGLSDAGHILLNLYYNGDSVPFVFYGGTLTRMPTGATAVAIDGTGYVALNISDSNGAPHAYLWRNGTVTAAGTLGGYSSFAHGVGATGSVVGEAGLSDGTRIHAFLYQNGATSDLGSLGGVFSRANAIDETSGVVGTTDIGTDERHAFLYASGTMTDLGVLGSGLKSEAFAINRSLQIVGQSESAFIATVQGVRYGGGLSAFFWQQGRMVDFNRLVDRPAPTQASIASASAINDLGDVIADGGFYVPVNESAGWIANFSLRCEFGGDAPIIGITVDGPTRPMLIRGVGSALSQLGVADGVADPEVTLYSNATSEIHNAGQELGTAAIGNSVGAFPLPTSRHDIAISPSLSAGAHTFSASSISGTPGTVLAEIYDPGGSPACRLRNGSGLVRLPPGHSAIAGFVIKGDGTKILLIRGVGPGLRPLGIGDAADAVAIQLVDSHGAVVAANTGWTQVGEIRRDVDPILAELFKETGAFALPNASGDSALRVAVPPGAYTLIVTNTGIGAGRVLAEIYDIL